MDMKYRQSWVAALEERFGEISGGNTMGSKGGPDIDVVYFADFPELGLLTAITCGLAEANHPEWVRASPELMVTLETTSPDWGMAAAYFASTFHTSRRFAYGDVFKLDTPLSRESEMNSLLLFGPPYLSNEHQAFVVGERNICLVGAYPLHEDEVELYGRIGLQAFWHLDSYDPIDPMRPSLAAA
jgi:hypothetical protein